MAASDDIRQLLNEVTRQGDLAERVRRYQQLAQRWPAFAPLWFNLADDLARDGRLDEARAAVLRAIALSPSMRDMLTPRLHALFAPPEPPRAPAPITPQPVAARPTPIAPRPLGPSEMPTMAAPEPMATLVLPSARGVRVERQLAASSATALYAGTRAGDGRPVGLRTIRDLPPREAERVLAAELRAPAVEGCARALALDALDDGTPALVIEAPRGEPLSARVGPRALSLREVAAFARSLSRTVDGIHRAGSSHGELRPDQVLVDEHGEATVLGHGGALARVGGTMALSDARVAWLPPEIGLGRAEPVATDVYGLGLLVYFAAAGAPPSLEKRTLTAPSLAAARMTVAGSALRPEERVLVEKLDPIVARCLAIVPSDRYRAVSELAVALGARPPDSVAPRASSPSPIAPPPARTIPAATPPRSRTGLAIALLAIAILVGVLGAWAIGHFAN